MNKRHFSAAHFRGGILGALLCFLSCQSYSAAPTIREELAWANSGFAFNLLQQLAAEQPGSNIFISPYSASTVLQMVSSGAAGTTQTEMRHALGISAMTPGNLFVANRETGGLINRKNTNFLLTAANAVWYKAGAPIERAFIEDDLLFFGAKVEGVDFSNPSSVAAINAWASEETRGKINQIASYPMDPRTQLFLANAVYFLGAWENPFDTNDTTPQFFYLNNGGWETVSMMSQTGSFNYCQTNGYQAVQLPYRGGDLAMYVFLPLPGTNLVDILGAMSGESWLQDIQPAFSAQQGTLNLPKFDLDYRVSLVPALKGLGMRAAFSNNADFAGISTKERLSISDVKQEAVVTVNELGTEAAAVTTVTIVGTVVGPVPPQAFQMDVDRPFLFVIQDQQAGMILFMGTVFQP
jgi:serpin B